MVDFRKKYTKYIKENVHNFVVSGDIDQENPVHPDEAEEIQDILRKKGVRAEVSPSETKYNEVVVKTSFSQSYIKKILDKENILESLEEKIKPYMVSYSDKYGKHYGFEDGDTLRDIQDKAQKLRKKGFQIDKMGRYNPPIDKKYMTGKTGVVEGLVAEATWEYVYELESDMGDDGGPFDFDGEVNAYSERDAIRKVEKLANNNRNRINKKLERSRKPGVLKVMNLDVVKESLVEGFVPLVPLNMRYMNKKKAQDAIDKVSDNQGNIRFVKHFQNDTVGLVKFIYGDKEVKNFEFQFPGIYYKNKKVTFHDLILKAREKVNAARKILGLGRFKEEKELEEKYFSQSNIAKALAIIKKVPNQPVIGLPRTGDALKAWEDIEDIDLGLTKHPKIARALFNMGEEKQMKEAFPKPKEDKEKKIKELENKVQKLEVEKSAELNPEPNPDTGEIPLQIGIAYKYIRDKAKGIVDKEDKKDKKKETEKVKVGKKTLTNKKKEKIDVEPEMDVM